VLEQEALAVYTRCSAAALSGGIPPAPPPARPASADAYLDAARERLAKIDAHLSATRRRDELIAEDGQLAMTEVAFEQVRQEVHRARAAVEDGTQRLHRIVTGAGLPPPRTAAEAVSAFRDACASRRQHDDAVRAAEAIRRRAAVINADTHALLRSRDHFEAELRERGGDPAATGSSPALDAEALRRLEMEAERARREAAVALTEAKALRARLAALVDTVPDLADLEDQRNACASARERGLRQLAALQRAVELIEEATRGAHRDLAPRLAAALESRLALLAGSRYRRVNVDTDHFAVSLLSAEREQFTPLELMSQGTRDQVSLLLRLALCEVLGSGGEPAPLLLDEPLASSDGRRRRAGVQFLHDLSATTQVVIATSDLALVEEFRELGDGACAVVMLGPELTVETVGRVAQRSPAIRTSPSSSETSSVNSGIRAAGTSPSRSRRAS
jgi:uncharacterized protein YhaN